MTMGNSRSHKVTHCVIPADGHVLWPHCQYTSKYTFYSSFIAQGYTVYEEKQNKNYVYSL